MLLTIAAGLSTLLGSIIFLSIKNFQSSSSYFFGMAAGAMIYISLFDLLPPALHQIGIVKTFGLMVLGIISIACITILIPIHKKNSCKHCKKKYNPYLSTGLITFVGIALHNFPEGMAVFMSTFANQKIGQLLAFATAIHNLPEGIAIAAPILYGTKSKFKAISYSLIAGLAEPLGALITFLILQQYLNQELLLSMFALIAGIMIYISIDELLPLCFAKGCSKLALTGIASGVVLIALSLNLG